MELDQGLLMQTFAVEAEEQLAAMAEGLVALEQHPDDEEVLASVFRAAHTLKGNAGTVGLSAVADRANTLEDTLDALRNGTQVLSADLVTSLLAVVDELRRELDVVGAVTETEGPAATQTGQRTTLRIDASKLDHMLSLSGEISIARGRLRTLLVAAGPAAVDALEAHIEAERLYRELQDEIMRARLVPLGPIFRQYQRVVRDLALTHSKRAELVVEGEGVEIDTTVGEHVRGPLMHMLRNAIDHGIESPELRVAAGKSAVGRITLSARREASHIVIEVRDDGAGFSRKRIAERAGVDDGARAMGDDDLLDMVFEPGFSTAEAVTDLSGRGVGMDVVRRNIEALRGTVAIESEEGVGAAVTLRLPLTLAIIEGFFVEVSGETFVIPLEAVTECQELPKETVPHADGSGVFNFRGKPLPYLRLREMFPFGESSPEREHVVVVTSGERQAGIAVDALLGSDQAVIKPLGKFFRDVPAVAGSTIGGNGRVALILDVASLLNIAEARQEHTTAERGIA